MPPRPTPTYLKLVARKSRQASAEQARAEARSAGQAAAVSRLFDGYAREEWKRVALSLWRLGALTSLDVQIAGRLLRRL